MIKVLVITNRFIYGGIEQFLLNLFENRKCPDIQFDLLTLISMRDEALIEKVNACGVNCRSLELEKYTKMKRQIYHYKKLYDLIKDEKYQVVHLNITNYVRSFDLLTARLAGAKVRIVHAHSSIKGESLARRLQRPCRLIYDLSATDYCACSDEAAKYLFSRSVVRRKAYQVIPNGINTKKYLYSEADRKKVRHELGIRDEELLIGHVGRLTEAKNHTFLLQVFREIKNLREASRLLLVGNGELRNEVEQEIRRLQLEDFVILYGTSPDVSRLLSAMDVFLFPSRWEGLGISAVEAQCNGLPCYISENVPASVLLTSNSMQLRITDGAEAWARTILDTHTRSDEVDRIEASGYGINSTIRKLEEIYRKAGE